VIACGLLKVPFARYVTAHVVGSSVYIAIFLALGAIFGPAILDQIHLPSTGLRLLWLLPLAVGLPLLTVRWGNRARSRQPAAPSRRRLLGAVLLGGFAGTLALTASFAATAAVAELLGASHPLNVAYSLLGWTMFGLESRVDAALLLLYVALLALLVGIAAIYNELVLPYLAPGGVSPSRQVLGLALLTAVLFGLLFLVSLIAEDPGSLALWWQTGGGPIMLLGAALGTLAYASTVVYGRVLAIAATPSLRRSEQ
jgi:hypothetical protein